MNNNQTITTTATVILSSMFLIACTFQVGDATLNAGNRVVGSGKSATETREISGANNVLIAGSGQVNVTVGSEESLTIRADDNILPYLTSEVHNGKLVLGTKPLTSITARSPIVYDLKVKSLNGVELAGSANVNGSGVDADKLNVVISGSGDIVLVGKANQQDVTITGSGKYNAPELTSQKASVSLMGSGAVVVQVSDSLNALITGSGNIVYIGSPKVEKTITGSGSVTPR